jgi:hypothetical protein
LLRVETQRFDELGFGFRGASSRDEHSAVAHADVGDVGRKFDRRREVDDGFHVPPSRGERCAEIALCFRQTRVQSDGPLELRNRQLRSALTRANQPETVMDHRHVHRRARWRDGDRTLVMRRGLVEAALIPQRFA